MEPILVDMDNTICQFDEEFDRQWQILYPKEVFVSALERKDFHIEKSYPKELQDQVTDIFHAPGFFRSLKPIEGAIQALHDLDGKGYDIKICTAPLTGAPTCMTEKYEWIKEHLGKRWVRKLIATDDKTIIRGCVLIDDKPSITGSVTPSWTQLFYDKPYNRASGGMRLIHWKFVEDILNNYMGVNIPSKMV